MMHIVPVPFRPRISKFFEEYSLTLYILYHLFNRYMIISNGGRFAISFQAKLLQRHYQRGLVRFGAARNSERVNKRKIEAVILYSQNKLF